MAKKTCEYTQGDLQYLYYMRSHEKKSIEHLRKVDLVMEQKFNQDSTDTLKKIDKLEKSIKWHNNIIDKIEKCQTGKQ